MSPLYFVLFVTLAVWVGLFAYLWRLDARVRELARRQASGQEEAAVEAPAAVLETPGGGNER